MSNIYKLKTKVCRKCQVEKETKDFYKHKRVCKICYPKITKEYREKNREKRSKSAKIWYEKTKEDRREHKKIYVRNRRKTDKLFHLRESTSRLIRMSLIRNNCKKSSKTSQILGCSFEEFKNHLEIQFESWMTWENRGKYNGEINYGWDIDHIIPLSSAKTEKELITLNHYSNLQPLCGYINRVIKKDKIF